jgi:NTE family protein
MLRALLEHQVTPDLVLGSSAGAINAVHFASDPSIDGVERLARAWIAMRQSDVFPRSHLHGALALVGRRRSLLDPRALERTLATHLTVARLEETRLPCYVIATDLRSGEERVLARGDALDALMASAAIPVLFPPRTVAGDALTDGSIASNTPIEAAIACGATRVVVLPTGFPCAVRAAPIGMAAMTLHIFSLLVARQLAAGLPRLQAVTRLRVVPPLCPIRVAPSDFSQAATLIEAAYRQTQGWIAAGGLDDDRVPPSLAPHTHGDGDPMSAM